MAKTSYFKKQFDFHPEHCPHSDCAFYFNLLDQNKTSTQHKRFHSKGWYRVKNSQKKVRRWICQSCFRTFSYTRFQFHYAMHYHEIAEPIFWMKNRGSSEAQIARALGVSKSTVNRVVMRLGIHALMKHAELTAQFKISEPVVYDDLENQAKSQYEPNNIGHAILKDSLFILDFTHSVMNRKGRMSERQKLILKEIEEKRGRFNPKAIRKSAAQIFDRLHGRLPEGEDTLVLYTDEKLQYKKALQYDLKGRKFSHITVSSKDARNFQNHLFAVNHHDLNIRHESKAFTRETIAFNKSHPKMVLSYALHMAYKNYFRPMFVKKHRLRPYAHTTTPAMSAGVTDHILKFEEFFDRPRRVQDVRLSEEWKDFALLKQPYQRELKFQRVVKG